MTRQASLQPGHPGTSPQRTGGAPPCRPRPREPRTRANARTQNRRSPHPQAEPRSPRTSADDAYVPVTPPGVIGGAVIHALRSSAGLTRRTLARTLTVTPATVRCWENGTIPLFAVPYDQIKQLAAALSQPGTQTSLLTELLIASQCDLLITRMLNGTEDYAEPPPIDEDTPEGAIARTFIRWALTSTIPARYEGRARPGPLIDHHANHELADLGRQLAAGEYGPSLVSFGIAVTGIASAG